MSERERVKGGGGSLLVLLHSVRERERVKGGGGPSGFAS